MPHLNIGTHRSLLQPTTLTPNKDTDLTTGDKRWKSLGPTPLGNHKVGLSTPQGAPGRIGGGDNGVRRLSELKLDSVPPGQIGGKRDQSVGQINKIINAIEVERGEDGKLSPRGEALREQLATISEAFDLLGAGPMVGDKLTAQMESLGETARDLKELLKPENLDKLPEGVRAQVKELAQSVLAQVEDRGTYLGHSVVDSPFSMSKMYESKAQFSEGAMRVIDKELERTDLTTGQRAKLEQARDEIFKARSEQMHGKARDHFGEMGDPKEVIGKKFTGGLGGLISGQTKALKEHVKDLVQGFGGHHRTPAETPKVDEQTIIEETLKAVFKEAGLSSKHVGHDFHQAMNDVLNNGQEWKPIVKEIQIQSGSETLLTYSETTPAGNFIESYQGKGFNSHSSTEYEHSVNLAQTRLVDGQGKVMFSGMRHGVISAFGIVPKEVAKMGDEELGRMIQDLLPKEHWVKEGERLQQLNDSLQNLGLGTVVEGEVSVGEPSLGETIREVRNNPELVDIMRAQANKNRAMETVQSTLLTDETLLRAALDGETVRLDILSISLLTPDHVRKGTNSNEQMMVKDQVKAWKDVSGIQTFQVRDPETGQMKEVKVDVRPIPCNYGVNEGAVKGKFGLSSSSSLGSSVMGWNNVAGLNGEAIGKLLGTDMDGLLRGEVPGGLIGEGIHKLEGEVANDRGYLRLVDPDGTNEQYAPIRARLSSNETKLAQARELVQQIVHIHQDESYKVAGKEPYKMPTRLAVLGDMFGVKVMWNCKSGKDRTGELDAEIKHFRLQMALTGQVPHYERTRSPSEITQFHEVVTHSGNFEMQRLNTGFAGFKLKGVDEVYEQFGGVNKHDEISQNYLGLSGYTAS
ncbi:inositol phosphate phosphatase SopB [Pseudothauera rhizosphaerae]|uniref:Uncharacterized protein n=1 Tax=Pseudothauera rhizosphaerae TaxID=2565932 RepID=A0A4S4ADW7_9RHOO|nr:inositol phosphate phosphatase SopB [Pseudothauera rhizosphaerae]THF57275.1 hypothetical protein E6O51_18435 [Pseudothauera rhizosphaerae]